MKDFIDELQDLRYLDWTNKKRSVGTPGCFLKAYEEKNGIRFYYKLSNYDSYRGIFEHECVNELIVSRLLDVLEDKKVNNSTFPADIFKQGLYKCRLRVHPFGHFTFDTGCDIYRQSRKLFYKTKH